VAEQAVDMQLVLSGLRRHRGIVIGAALLGALLGIGSVLLWPPMYASSSLVLLPTRAAADPEQMAEQVKTETRIATSDSVLGPAARGLRPRMPVGALARHVSVTSETPLVLKIQGRAEEPRRAEDISRAVANAEVAYIAKSSSSPSNARRALLTAREKELRETLEETAEQVRATTARLRGEEPQSPQGKADATALAKLTAERGRLVLQLDQVQSETAETIQPSAGASIIQGSSPAKRAGLLGRYLGATLTGMLLAVLLAAGAITLLTRRDPRLYFRDDIADAVGTPVIASVGTPATGSVADWISLLHDYTPGIVDAWALRRALRQLGFTELPSASEKNNRAKVEHPRSIAVITLSGDQRGLAAGPELAAYVASAGVRTHLVAAQRHETAAALWAAFAGLEQGQETRPGLSVDTRSHPLDRPVHRLGPADSQPRSRRPPRTSPPPTRRPHERPHVDLTVVLAVLDRQEPKLLDLPADTVVVLALSAGSATAQELARAAVAVDEAGERIRAIVVTDPDHLDRTSGRLLQYDRVRQIPLPTRLTSTPAPKVPRDGADSKRSQG